MVPASRVCSSPFPLDGRGKIVILVKGNDNGRFLRRGIGIALARGDSTCHPLEALI